MSTFNEDNYLDVTIFLDGKYEIDKPFDYEQYKKDLQMDMAAYKLLLNTNATGDVREHARDQLDALEKLHSVLKAIWEDDPADFFEYYTEEDENE